MASLGYSPVGRPFYWAGYHLFLSVGVWACGLQNCPHVAAPSHCQVWQGATLYNRHITCFCRMTGTQNNCHVYMYMLFCFCVSVRFPGAPHVVPCVSQYAVGSVQCFLNLLVLRTEFRGEAQSQQDASRQAAVVPCVSQYALGTVDVSLICFQL